MQITRYQGMSSSTSLLACTASRMMLRGSLLLGRCVCICTLDHRRQQFKSRFNHCFCTSIVEHFCGQNLLSANLSSRSCAVYKILSSMTSDRPAFGQEAYHSILWGATACIKGIPCLVLKYLDQLIAGEEIHALIITAGSSCTLSYVCDC